MNIRRYKQQNEFSYTLGATLTIELLKRHPSLVRRVFIHSKLDSEVILNIIEGICQIKEIPIEYNDKAFRILSDKDNTYVIGEFLKYEGELELGKRHIVLNSPANAGNLGTIIRSAIGFKINNLAIIRPAVDIFDPKTIRASMGAIFLLNFRYFDSFDNYLDYVGKREVFPFMLKGGKTLREISFPKVCSLIFGNEAKGLPEHFHKFGQSILINQSSEIDSLNLPIAVGIALYELSKDEF